ncbi:unnamed protein product [Cuscuta campestris]|uniref:Retrotransposon gag domain-containing protein n=1 Tax=Cuscuta campestris TaxID=132261 RepID=A0A484KWC6_9ASTE|nr:unnamed protein product [Cuscuta campestris]
MSSSQQINATSAQVQATNEGASIPVAATIPVISAPVLPLGLSTVPTASVISLFVTPVPSAGPRVTFPPSMTQFMNDPANLQAIRGFGQVMAMCQQNGGMPFLPGEVREAEPARTRRSRSNRQEPARTRASHQEGEAESKPRLPVANWLTIPNDRVQQMEAKLERLEKKVGEKNDRDKPLAGSPFTTRVHLTPFPRKVKIDAPRFTGKEDPEIHLDSFNQSATMNGCTDEEKCLLFFQTLRNRDTEWFNKLRPGSIDSFSDLASKFKAMFQENCTKRKKFTYLSTAGQRESENLTQFLTRWKEEVDKVEEMDDKTVLSLLLNGLRAGELYKEFCRKPPATYQEAYHTAWEFAKAETQLRAKREAKYGHKSKPVQVKKEEAPGPSRPRDHYDPVIRVVNTEECQEVRKAPVIPPENPTGQVGRQWSGTYCSYHRSDSHNTSECKSVKGVIRQMIDSGELDKDYLQKAQEKSHQWVRPTAPGNDRDNDRWRNNRPRERQPAPKKEDIGMIFGGPEGGDSAAQRKNWVRSIYVGEVSAEPPRRKHTRREPIVFTDRDLPPTSEDHNDPLVITMDINGVDVARVLVDTGSSVNILYLETFQKLRLCRTQLEPLKTPLSGFTGDTVEAEGSIVLPVELGSGEKTVWKKMRFIVVDIKCVHNAILGRPDINKVGAVISMPHLCMKFHTPDLPVNKPTEQWWEMAVDGASGPRGYGGGIVFTTPEGFKIYHAIVFNFKLTNNEAEYEALAGGLRLAQALKISRQNEEDHLAELNLVEERRMAAEVKMSTYQQVVKKYHDNKVGPRYFQVGDEVLRRREASRPGDGGKLAKNLEGPYRVRAIIRPGTYRLETLEGVPVERTWNSHHLRKFYK